MASDIKIGLLIIATRKYKQFINQFLKSADKYFFPDNNYINVYLFIDDPSYKIESHKRIKIKLFKIKPLKFPYVTLYRYYMFSQIKKHLYSDCDYIFYSDVDMMFVDSINKEILPIKDINKITAVRHCGFYKGGGAWGDNPNSLSYTPVDKRIKYYAGGFQGGEVSAYVKCVDIMALNIEEDRKSGIMAIWHDETHWNKFLSTILDSFKELDVSYCMVEDINLRKEWGINNIKPKILALSKDHKSIRE